MTLIEKTGLAMMASGLMLGGCAVSGPYAVYDAPPGPVAVQRAEYGVVEAIEVTRDGRTTGVGAVLGGVAGGVIGHQFGSGRGNTAATIAGALGGALVATKSKRRARRTGIASSCASIPARSSRSTMSARANCASATGFAS